MKYQWKGFLFAFGLFIIHYVSEMQQLTFWFEAKTHLGGPNSTSLSAGAPLCKKNVIAIPQL